jgi:hypothetical protein
MGERLGYYVYYIGYNMERKAYLRRKEVGNNWLRKGARFGLLSALPLGTVVNSYSMRKEI